MKLCKDCLFYKAERCHNARAASLSPVTGKPIFLTAATARIMQSVCGPDGDLFEAAPQIEQQTWIDRLKGVFNG